jgi:hypothetical protein
VRCRAIAKTIMHPKALKVMSGVVVLIADGMRNESNHLDSEEMQPPKQHTG